MSSPQHEPTMEEILASIRKIISEDAPSEAPAAPGAPVAETPAPPADILELTHELVETPAPEPVPVPAPAPVAMPADDIIFEAETPAPPPASNDIFSDHTRKALDDVFDNIPDEEPVRAPSPAPAPVAMTASSGSSVESVFERAVRESFEPVLNKYLADNSTAVVEKMKPLIREWMDEHFPALLEGAVRSEVERVVKARGKR